MKEKKIKTSLHLNLTENIFDKLDTLSKERQQARGKVIAMIVEKKLNTINIENVISLKNENNFFAAPRHILDKLDAIGRCTHRVRSQVVSKMITDFFNDKGTL